MADIKVRKANSVLTIPEEQKAEYMARGFDVVGLGGVVVEAATPTDVPTLQAKLAEVLAENAKLKEQIKSLQAKPKTQEETPTEEKPKRTRTKK